MHSSKDLRRRIFASIRLRERYSFQSVQKALYRPCFRTGWLKGAFAGGSGRTILPPRLIVLWEAKDRGCLAVDDGSVATASVMGAVRSQVPISAAFSPSCMTLQVKEWRWNAGIHATGPDTDRPSRAGTRPDRAR
jgi:hypothetical protein